MTNKVMPDTVRPVFEGRIRTVALAPVVLVEMCKQGNRLDATCVEGLPADALLWEASYDQRRNVFLLDVSSASFDPAPHGLPYPEVPVTFQQRTP